MSWLQTAYLIAEVIAIPLTGLLTRVLTMRGLFVAAISLFSLASLGCAASGGFASLVAWRVVQGFAGGVLIPSVFTAVFLLFPARQQTVATTLAGVLAVLAPTVGPLAGGWITETYSWHWLFLINIGPGIVAAALAAWFLPAEKTDVAQARRIDIVALGPDGTGAGVAGDRAEGGAAVRLGFRPRARPAGAERRQPRGLRAPHARARDAHRRSQRARRPQLRHQLRA